MGKIAFDAFISAIEIGDNDALIIVNAFVAENSVDLINADVVVDDFITAPPLVLAIQAGHSVIVNALLAVRGINENALDNKGCSALMYAVNINNQANIDALLAAPFININARNQTGKTALMYAVDDGELISVKRLLDIAGIDITAVDNDQNNALKIAINKDCPERVMLLLAALDNDARLIDRYSSASLKIAIQSGHVAVVNVILAALGVYTSDIGMLMMNLKPKNWLAIVSVLEQANRREAIVAHRMVDHGESFAQAWAATSPEVQGLLANSLLLPCDDVIGVMLSYLAPINDKEATELMIIEKIRSLTLNGVLTEILDTASCGNAKRLALLFKIRPEMLEQAIHFVAENNATFKIEDVFDKNQRSDHWGVLQEKLLVQWFIKTVMPMGIHSEYPCQRSASLASIGSTASTPRYCYLYLNNRHFMFLSKC